MQRHFGNRKSGKWCGSEVDTHELSKEKSKERKPRFYNRNTNSNNNNNNIYAESSDVNVGKTPKESHDNENRCMSEDESALDESALKELQEIIESVHIDPPPRQNVDSHEHYQNKLLSSSLSWEESKKSYEPFKESDNINKNVLELKHSSSSTSLPSDVKNSTDANKLTNALSATVNDARAKNNNTQTTISNIDKTNNNEKDKKPRSRQRGKEIELPDTTSSNYQNKKETNYESNSYHNNNKERPYGKYAYKEQNNKEYSRSHSNNKYVHYKKEDRQQHSQEYNRDYKKNYNNTHNEETKKYSSYHHQNDNRHNYNVDNSIRYYYDEYDKHETNKHLKHNYDDRYNDNNDEKNKNDVDWRRGNRTYYNRYDRRKDNKYNHYDNDNRKEYYHHQYNNDKNAKYKDDKAIYSHNNDDKKERRNKYVDSNNAWNIKEKVQELKNMKDMNRASKNTSFTASHELRHEREVHEEEKELTHNVTESEEERNIQHYKQSDSHTRYPVEEQYLQRIDAIHEEEEEEEEEKQEIIHKEPQEESVQRCKTSEELHEVNSAESCERSHSMIEDKEPITDTTSGKASPLESAKIEEQHSNTDHTEKQTNRQHKIKKRNSNNNNASKPQTRKPYLLCDLCNHIISDCDLILNDDETRNVEISDSIFDKFSNDQIAQECHNYREHRELYECLTKTRPFRAFVNADVEAISYDKLDNRGQDDYHDVATSVLSSPSSTVATDIVGNDLSAAKKSSRANYEKEENEKEEGEEENEEEEKKNMALGQFAVALARTADHGPEMFAVIQNACVQINEIIHNSVECRPFIFLFGSCVSMGVWDGLGDADFTAIPQRIIREHSKRDKSKNKKKIESSNRGNKDKDTNLEKKCGITENNDNDSTTANNNDGCSTRLVESVNTKMESEETAREESLLTHTTTDIETEKSEYTNEREKRVEEKVEGEERNNIIKRDVNESIEQCSNKINDSNEKESKEQKVLNAIMSKNEESSLLIETARRLRAAGFLFEELEVIHHTRIPLIKRARKLKRAHELKHVGELYYIDVHYDAYYLKNGFRQKTCHRFHDAQFNVGMKLSEESEFHDVVSCRNPISALRLFKTRESPGIQKTWRQHTRLPEIFSIDFDLSCRVFGVRNSWLLRKYLSQHCAFRVGNYVIKKWSKACGINNSRVGYLTSYAISILWIYFLLRHGKVEFIDPSSIPAIPEEWQMNVDYMPIWEEENKHESNSYHEAGNNDKEMENNSHHCTFYKNISNSNNNTETCTKEIFGNTIIELPTNTDKIQLEEKTTNETKLNLDEKSCADNEEMCASETVLEKASQRENKLHVCTNQTISNSVLEVGRLLREFFKFYAHFDWDNEVISLRKNCTRAESTPDAEAQEEITSTTIKSTTKELHWTHENMVEDIILRNRVYYYICIEDVYEDDLNLGRHLTQPKASWVKAQFLRAWRVCNNTEHIGRLLTNINQCVEEVISIKLYRFIISKAGQATIAQAREALCHTDADKEILAAYELQHRFSDLWEDSVRDKQDKQNDMSNARFKERDLNEVEEEAFKVEKFTETCKEEDAVVNKSDDHKNTILIKAKSNNGEEITINKKEEEELQKYIMERKWKLVCITRKNLPQLVDNNKMSQPNITNINVAEEENDYAEHVCEQHQKETKYLSETDNSVHKIEDMSNATNDEAHIKFNNYKPWILPEYKYENENILYLTSVREEKETAEKQRTFSETHHVNNEYMVAMESSKRHKALIQCKQKMESLTQKILTTQKCNEQEPCSVNTMFSYIDKNIHEYGIRLESMIPQMESKMWYELDNYYIFTSYEMREKFKANLQILSLWLQQPINIDGVTIEVDNLKSSTQNICETITTRMNNGENINLSSHWAYRQNIINIIVNDPIYIIHKTEEEMKHRNNVNIKMRICDNKIKPKSVNGELFYLNNNEKSSCNAESGEGNLTIKNMKKVIVKSTPLLQTYAGKTGMEESFLRQSRKLQIQKAKCDLTKNCLGTCDECGRQSVTVFPSKERKFDRGWYCKQCWEAYEDYCDI